MNRPNIVIVVTDDQGYGDLSCMGATDFSTPHMDQAAGSGALFTCMYSNSPVCSPSRASLLTGRYPARAGVRSILPGHRKAAGLSPDVPTIGSVVRQSGYKTGLVGKWHLGLAPESRPTENGFDYFFGFMAGCIDYYSHIFYWGTGAGEANPIHDLWENEQEVFFNGEYMTELITEKSVEFIRENSSDPFLLYVAYNAPHYPMHAPKKYLDRFPDLPPDRQIMAAMLSAVDDGVGEIRAELTRQGVLENTIFYFQSDNGPSRESRNWLDGRDDPYYGGTTGRFKGHKFSLFEGGIRVPAFISWPAKIASDQVIDIPCAAMDIYPTLLEIIGIESLSNQTDGISILPLLLGKEFNKKREIYWEMGKQRAVRFGDYKLVIDGVLAEEKEPREHYSLYNLAEDPGERVNLAQELPDYKDMLEHKVCEWFNNIVGE